MGLIALSFLAGILTILSPCVLPFLPVIIGGSLSNDHKWRPVVITASLASSVVAFTLLLKWSTVFIAVEPQVWSIISGSIIVVLGIITVFPVLWDKVSAQFNFTGKSHELLEKSSHKESLWGSVLTGIALGPVFSSCSPTYALILATVLPQSFAVGLVNLIAYAIGLSIVLLLIAVFGQKIISRLKWAADPKGWFKRIIGILFIAVGIAIMLGIDKDIETALVERGFGITALEERLVEEASIDMEDDLFHSSSNSAVEENSAVKFNVPTPVPAPEFAGANGWINSNPLTMEDLRGKVVLIDFWTYSCINCIRTIPYINEWHEKYADDGLVIVGVHAPEFAFEKVQANVEDAIAEYGIQYPVMLDNDFTTWRSYSNRYWPAKYFIDKEGNVRHFHFGEGEYEESEEVIRALLEEGGEELDESELTSGIVPVGSEQTPETYLGYLRIDEAVKNDELAYDESTTYSYEDDLNADEWGLMGEWTVTEEHSLASGADGEYSQLDIRVSGTDVYLVMGPREGVDSTTVRVVLNGEALPDALAGDDIVEGVVTVDEYRLYRLVESPDMLSDLEIELQVESGTELFAFTFGTEH